MAAFYPGQICEIKVRSTWLYVDAAFEGASRELPTDTPFMILASLSHAPITRELKSWLICCEIGLGWINVENIVPIRDAMNDLSVLADTSYKIIKEITR